MRRVQILRFCDVCLDSGSENLVGDEEEILYVSDRPDGPNRAVDLCETHWEVGMQLFRISNPVDDITNVPSRAVGDRRKYPCDSCGMTYLSSSGLRYHRNKHHPAIVVEVTPKPKRRKASA